MAEFNPDAGEFEGLLKNEKEGGPREAGRHLASLYVREVDMDPFKELAASGQMPDTVSEWLGSVELPKGAMKKIRNGFNSRVAELLDSLERSGSWEGFTGLSEAERWVELRKG